VTVRVRAQPGCPGRAGDSELEGGPSRSSLGPATAARPPLTNTAGPAGRQLGAGTARSCISLHVRVSKSIPAIEHVVQGDSLSSQRCHVNVTAPTVSQTYCSNAAETLSHIFELASSGILKFMAACMMIGMSFYFFQCVAAGTNVQLLLQPLLHLSSMRCSTFL
jgi:hypothetical protein